MLENFVAIVLFDKRPSLTATGLETSVRNLESDIPVEVSAGAADDALLLKLGDVEAVVVSQPGPMPQEAAVPSLGMADISEADMKRLMTHQSHVTITCSNESAGVPMDKMVALLKTGMALCEAGGWALCLPASGLCLMADDLHKLAEQNRGGPRVWGVDETEANLPAYEKHTLWDSLRREAQPAGLLVGFVPAEVENRTWFFSAGHSLFGLPEITYTEGNLDDFETVRELFRFIFPFFYQKPDAMQGGKTVKTNDNALSIALENLSPQYGDLQSPTGTLRVRLVTTAPDSDWD